MKKKSPKPTWDAPNETVKCGKCRLLIGLRDGETNGATGLAWFDPYRGKSGMQVHYGCLSERRRDEIKTAIELNNGEQSP